MKQYIVAISLAITLGLVAWLCNTDEPTAEQHNYCEMVDIWNDTEGEYGWPDYNDNFDEVCND
jgi:hypothetical protein